MTAPKAVAGVVLLIGRVMCLRATAISFGWLGLSRRLIRARLMGHVEVQ